MKQLLCILAVIWGTVTVATAGPNQGGVLWVHDTGMVFSTDLTLPPVSMPPADCAGVDSQQAVDGVERVWKVYAAFPLGSHPRLKTCGWAIQFPDAATSPLSYVSVAGGGIPDEDGPGTDFYIGDLGFPTANGGQIGQSFPSGPRTATVVTLFYFYGFGYHASGPLPIWSTAQHGAPGNRVFGDDGNPTNEDPITGYGSLGFGTPGVTPCPFADPDAACCAPGGDCAITIQSACPEPSVWHADWYACTPNPCAGPPPGACCFFNGTCSMLMPVVCANYNGEFHDGPCEPSPCPQLGACCRFHGSCSIMLPAPCVSAGGFFVGGACEPNPCPQPGACCFHDGHCALLIQPFCISISGSFFDGPCTPNPCPPPPPGACCLTDGVCLVLLPDACGNSGGVFHESGCEPNPCPLPGACCFPDGSCSALPPGVCASQGGSFLGGVCEPSPCPEASACCFSDGRCLMLTSAACGEAGGVRYGGSCLPNPCPQPPPPGACCLASGVCVIATPADCASSGGTFHGGSCWPHICLTSPPPGGGDTFATAAVIPGLPFTGEGTTIGYVNDYDAACPYAGSTSPDVVYRYEATGSVNSFNVDLCFSSYDTKVYVYDAADLNNPVACNDDYYFAAPCYAYSSYVGQVPAVAGHTYYIVIDGYGGAGGVYSVTVTDGGTAPPSGACCAASGACTITPQVQCAGIWQGEGTGCAPNPCPPPPSVTCPTGSLIEGEPLCQDNYIDNYNGGCNSTPVVWQSLAPQAGGCAVMCGKSCTYLVGGSSNRDSDWFLSAGAGVLTQTLTADFPFMMAMFTGTDCAGLVYTYYVGAAGETGTLSGYVTPGTEVGFFAANQGFSGFPIEGTYLMSVCGIQDPAPAPGACCTEAGGCDMVTPKACAGLGGRFLGDPTCVPNPCVATPTVSTSWGAVKAWFLDSSVRPRDVRRTSRTRRPVAITPAPAATARPSGCPVPDLLGVRRPPKPGSGSVGGR